MKTSKLPITTFTVSEMAPAIIIPDLDPPPSYDSINSLSVEEIATQQIPMILDALRRHNLISAANSAPSEVVTSIINHGATNIAILIHGMSNACSSPAKRTFEMAECIAKAATYISETAAAACAGCSTCARFYACPKKVAAAFRAAHEQTRVFDDCANTRQRQLDFARALAMAAFCSTVSSAIAAQASTATPVSTAKYASKATKGIMHSLRGWIKRDT